MCSEASTSENPFAMARLVDLCPIHSQLRLDFLPSPSPSRLSDQTHILCPSGRVALEMLGTLLHTCFCKCLVA